MKGFSLICYFGGQFILQLLLCVLSWIKYEGFFREWDVMKVNDKRQTVIEVVATQAYWTNLWLGHVTGSSPMVEVSRNHKARAAGKIDFSSELYLIAFEIKIEIN